MKQIFFANYSFFATFVNRDRIGVATEPTRLLSVCKSSLFTDHAD